MQNFSEFILLTDVHNSMYFGKNIKYLRKLKGLNQDEMQAGTGIQRATWSDYEREITEPEFLALMRISEYFGVTVDELLKDDIEKKQHNVHLNENSVEKKNKENVHLNVHPNVHLSGQKGGKTNELKISIVAESEVKYGGKMLPIPITDLSVAAGAGAINDGNIEVSNSVLLPPSFVKPGHTYLCVRIKGESMAPTLQDGGYVIIRLLDRTEWAKMPDERVFTVIDTEGKAYLKRVKNRFKQGFIVLRSDNPDYATYPSFNLQANEITAIWYVEWYFSAKMPNIHDQFYTRLQQIEDKVDKLLYGPNKNNPKLK